VIRAATRRAMREMGNQFVLGETIEDAVTRGRDSASQGYTFSYDMLGEAALTDAEAAAFSAPIPTPSRILRATAGAAISASIPVFPSSCPPSTRATNRVSVTASWMS